VYRYQDTGESSFELMEYLCAGQPSLPHREKREATDSSFVLSLRDSDHHD
jgi:hypothetical protein